MPRDRESGEVARRSSLPRGVPLLIGRVRVDERRQPAVQLQVWCPFCRVFHVHDWPAERRVASHVEHRKARCLGHTPFRKEGYFIGLDYEARRENDECFARYDALTAPGRDEPPQQSALAIASRS